MSDTEIVRMANDIAAFYTPYPHDEAVTDIAQHIRDFWDPRMRRAMAEHIAMGGAGLSPLARAGAEAALRGA